MNEELPKPGTKFRVKAGCDAAYRAGDTTALVNGEGQTVEFISVRPSDCRHHPGQWMTLWRGPYCDKEIIVGPNWLEPVEEPWFNPGELVMCAKSGARCWENGHIRWLDGALCGVEWLSDGRVSPVKRQHLRRIENDVPSPPVAGKGVHAQSLGGDGAKTKQSPAENPRARRNMDTIKITTQTLINGAPADRLSKSDILGIIRDQESEIKRLESLAHKPEFLEKELTERAAGLAALVALVDEREKTADANAPVTRAELAEILKK